LLRLRVGRLIWLLVTQSFFNAFESVPEPLYLLAGPNPVELPSAVVLHGVDFHAVLTGDMPCGMQLPIRRRPFPWRPEKDHRHLEDMVAPSRGL
jgi:hypothetical protein